MGPNVSTLGTPDSIVTSVTNFIEGSYTFELKATDSNGTKVSSDTMALHVIHDTLSGKEFIFQNRWEGDSLYNPGVALWIDAPSLFYTAYRLLDVSLQFDTSITWLDVPRLIYPGWPSNPGYLYHLGQDADSGSPAKLEIYNTNWNYALINRKVNVRVKFL
jgi:hypothetical protein